MSQVCAIMGLLAETPLHAGAGAATGVIDLPIQREAHTDWPVVFGSGVKGALRARADECKSGSDGDWVEELFGRDPRPGKESEDYFAGALAVGDARLLLLPVRSLTSHFKWVTCPALLQRFSADCLRLRLDRPNLDALDNALNSAGDALAVVQEKPQGQDDRLFLEEYSFTIRPMDLAGLVTAIARIMQREKAPDDLKEQLVIISNDMFAHLSRHATPVAAHVAIDNETKTVKSGALWYEETLPPETLLYSCLVGNPVRRPSSGEQHNAQWVLDQLREKLFAEGRSYLQLGGNETVGMGWCAVALIAGASEGK